MSTDKPVYWLDIDDLMKVFRNYPSKEALYKAIQRGSFPVKTFKLGTKIYADREAVRAYFIKIRDEALAKIEETT